MSTPAKAAIEMNKGSGDELVLLSFILVRVINGRKVRVESRADGKRNLGPGWISGGFGARKGLMTREGKGMPGWAWALLVAAGTALVFLPALRFPFFPFWDDDIHVHANPHIAQLSWGSVGALWAGPWQQLYIPLTYTVWAGLAALSRWADGLPVAAGPLNAVWFHGANVLVHAVSAALAFVLLRRVLGQFAPGVSNGRMNLAAALGAFFSPCIRCKWNQSHGSRACATCSGDVSGWLRWLFSSGANERNRGDGSPQLCSSLLRSRPNRRESRCHWSPACWR